MPESSPSSFRHVEEKHVSSEIHCMVWSPKMDLLATANANGEVIVYRLSWQKVWTMTPSSDDAKALRLAWRPDGKVLAVNCENGAVLLCNVEDSSVLHTLEIHADVTSLSWNSEDPIEQPSGETELRDCFQDLSTHFLPKLPPFSKAFTGLRKSPGEDGAEDSKKLFGQTELNVLVIGTATAQVHLFAYGIFPLCVLKLNESAEVQSLAKVHGTQLSKDLSVLSLIVEEEEADGSRRLKYLAYDSTLLASHHREVRILALKFGQMLSLLGYLDSTIHQMSEAWEDILLEVDSKLMKFAEEKHKVCSGSVSNDFLRLLMLGMPSDELKNFLLQDLTDKGLKKLGLSIETSYSNIQKLVMKHLQSVGQSIVYHLCDLRGMSLWPDKFGVLGLCHSTLQEAVSIAGCFMLTASELQQVIDGSMKNFKAFFRWLYVVIQRLCDEPIPPELSKMTQQDLNFVAQFLKENFTQDYDEQKTGFKLEKVGQYLKNEDLTDPPDNSANPWVAFLNEHTALKDSALVYPMHSTKSLLQVYDMLVESVEQSLSKCADIVGSSLTCFHLSDLCQIPNAKDFQPKISQMSKEMQGQSYIYSIFTTSPAPTPSCFLLRHLIDSPRTLEISHMRIGEIHPESLDDSNASNTPEDQRHSILDLTFYDANTMSLLLLSQNAAEQEEMGGNGFPVLAQAPLSALEKDGFVLTTKGIVPLIDTPHLFESDVGPHIDAMNWRRLDNMKAASFAVSGTRKVACVLFASLRRVRLFLMDVEDEDDEEEEDEEEEEVVVSRVEEEEEEDASMVEEENKENTSKESMDL